MRNSSFSRFLAGLAVASLCLTTAAALTGEGFVATGSLADGVRDTHAAVRLADGRVLVVGGEPANHGSPKRSSSETYDPGTGLWTVSGSMSTERNAPTANLLADGSVLVAGGGAASGAVFASTEVWTAATGQFSAGPAMSVPRTLHRVVNLSDGTLLAVGGTSTSSTAFALTSAETYDPSTGAWTLTSAMASSRNNPIVVRLLDGRVLVAGGNKGSEGGFASVASCEIYSPATRSFTAAASMAAARTAAGGILLADGRVVVGGGSSGANSIHTVEVYDPSSDVWRTAPGSLGAGGPGMTLTRLADGRVLAAGGYDYASSTPERDADLYEPAVDTISALDPMGSPRYAHTATLLANGRVLMAGGASSLSIPPYGTSTAELFVPDPPAAFVLTEPSGIVIQQGEPFTIRWTGGHSSMFIDVLLIDRQPDGTPNAALFYIALGIPNTGSFEWTFPEDLPYDGPCGRTYHFYIQNTIRTMWTYGPDFVVACGAPNQAPVADAGPDQGLHAGDTFVLDGSNSHDDNTASASLTYAWTLTSRPAGSTAVLADADTATPAFTADLVGTYVASLTVGDAEGLSSPADTVTISSSNLPPTADAGVDRVAVIDTETTIGGAAADPEGDTLSYEWTLVSAPAGSAAALGGATTLSPTLTPDVTGSYVLSLVASDPYDDSLPDTVTLTVITGSEAAAQEIHGAAEQIESLPTSALDSPGHRSAMSSQLGNVLKDLQKGKTDAAIAKLRNVIDRVDGCALRGSVDGAGPSRDWIVDCTAQQEVYALLQDALVLLLP